MPVGLSVRFSTLGRDMDTSAGTHCADVFGGGWWYTDCGNTKPNGAYYYSTNADNEDRLDGILWNTWRSSYSLRYMEIRIREHN